MELKWTAEARSSFTRIISPYFSPSETKEYKKRLLIKILAIMESMPANESEWQGNYRILVDNYKVYFNTSNEST
ncbi:hypothetical protein [Bacillus sp. FJAT-29937]|uniref:hypothetical protein n=1 Tax=Bacillus sp. FJAT-29937 TaxID=1720553 RepID=UPI00083012F1|nr:hypothetical protein [Bacillus sp. FJAT-29937]